MTERSRWCTLIAVLVLIAPPLAGCFRSRQSTYRDVRHGRTRSYRRWREAEDTEDLPQLEGKLGVEDAARVALAFNKSLRNVAQEKARAEGRLVEAYSEALPTLELSADYTRLDQIFVVDLGVESFQVGDKNNWGYQVNLNQPLFKGGSIPAAVRGAQLFRYASDETVRRAVQDVLFQVANAYYDALLAQHLVSVQEDALRFAEANLNDVRARAEQGMAIRYDVLRAELEVSNVKADLISQRNERDRALTALLRAMGVSQKSEVQLSDAMTYLPTEPSYDRAVELAYRNRPDLYQRELNLRLEREVLKGLKSEYWPSLEAWGWFRWAKPDPHEASNIEWDRQWQAGLALSWTLFDGLKREGRILQQKAVLRQSAIVLTDTEQKVLQEVRNAILDLKNARELVQSQRLNLVQANEGLRLVTIGAREGVNTELEVLDARAALTRARGRYYEALHSHVLARIRLQRAVGMLGPPPGEGEVPTEGPPPGVIEEFAKSEQARPPLPAEGPAAEPAAQQRSGGGQD